MSHLMLSKETALIEESWVAFILLKPADSPGGSLESGVVCRYGDTSGIIEFVITATKNLNLPSCSLR